MSANETINMDEDAYKAYRSVIVSPTLRSIWAQVYGESFWPDLDPPWTQATIEDVRFVRADWARTRRHGSSTSAAVPAASCASLRVIVGSALSASTPIRWRYGWRKNGVPELWTKSPFRQAISARQAFPRRHSTVLRASTFSCSCRTKRRSCVKWREPSSRARVSRAPPLNSGRRARQCQRRHSTHIRAPSRRQGSLWRSTKRRGAGDGYSKGCCLQFWRERPNSAARSILLPGHASAPGPAPAHRNWQTAGARGFACVCPSSTCELRRHRRVRNGSFWHPFPVRSQSDFRAHQSQQGVTTVGFGGKACLGGGVLARAWPVAITRAVAQSTASPDSRRRRSAGSGR